MEVWRAFSLLALLFFVEDECFARVSDFVAQVLLWRQLPVVEFFDCVGHCPPETAFPFGWAIYPKSWKSYFAAGVRLTQVDCILPTC